MPSREVHSSQVLTFPTTVTPAEVTWYVQRAVMLPAERPGSAGQEDRTEQGTQAPRPAVDHPPAAAAQERPRGIFRSGALLVPGWPEGP